MRPFSPQLARPLTTAIRRTTSQSPPHSFARAMSSSNDLKIESTNISSAPGVDLSSHQKTLVGSVLDLFAGRPSLAKLQLWSDEGEFTDPLTIAKGRKQYEAQWYGLQTAFSEIERLHHEVKSNGNPIEMDLKTRYVVKGIGKEQTIQSLILIHTDASGEKIVKVEDKWDGKLPESSIANVSLFSPFSWERYAEGWVFWGWSLVWETWVWRVSESPCIPLPCSLPPARYHCVLQLQVSESEC